jgi:hypothetical protein
VGNSKEVGHFTCRLKQQNVLSAQFSLIMQNELQLRQIEKENVKFGFNWHFSISLPVSMMIS